MAVLASALLVLAATAPAQTINFDSGSTGALGDVVITNDTPQKPAIATITVNIPANAPFKINAWTRDSLFIVLILFILSRKPPFPVAGL